MKKIIETEAQARKIIEEAGTQSQGILSQASRDAERARQEILAQAQRQIQETLKGAKAAAEEEAAKSDFDTDQLLTNYQKSFQAKKDVAVEKAVELILRG